MAGIPYLEYSEIFPQFALTAVGFLGVKTIAFLFNLFKY